MLRHRQGRVTEGRSGLSSHCRPQHLLRRVHFSAIGCKVPTMTPINGLTRWCYGLWQVGAPRERSGVWAREGAGELATHNTPRDITQHSTWYNATQHSAWYNATHNTPLLIYNVTHNIPFDIMQYTTQNAIWYNATHNTPLDMTQHTTTRHSTIQEGI